MHVCCPILIMFLLHVASGKTAPIGLVSNVFPKRTCYPIHSINTSSQMTRICWRWFTFFPKQRRPAGRGGPGYSSPRCAEEFVGSNHRSVPLLWQRDEVGGTQRLAPHFDRCRGTGLKNHRDPSGICHGDDVMSDRQMAPENDSIRMWVYQIKLVVGPLRVVWFMPHNDHEQLSMFLEWKCT